MKRNQIKTFDYRRGFGFTMNGVFVHMNDGRVPELVGDKVVLGSSVMPPDRYPKQGDRIVFVIKRIDGKRNAAPWCFEDDYERIKNKLRESIVSGLISKLGDQGFPPGEMSWGDGSINVRISIRRSPKGPSNRRKVLSFAVG